MSPGSSRQTVDIDAFTASVSRAIAHATETTEIVEWLESQPYVHSARLEDILLKSNPPQRRITVDLDLAESGRSTLTIDVFTFDDRQFQLREIHRGES